jgi:hypothetical protein
MAHSSETVAREVAVVDGARIDDDRRVALQICHRAKVALDIDGVLAICPTTSLTT